MIIEQVALIKLMLPALKEKIDPTKWDETPLPIIVAPPAWVEEVRATFAPGEGDVVVDSIHGCSVVVDTAGMLVHPALIDHDGKAYSLEITPEMLAPAEPASQIITQ